MAGTTTGPSVWLGQQQAHLCGWDNNRPVSVAGTLTGPSPYFAHGARRVSRSLVCHTSHARLRRRGILGRGSPTQPSPVTGTATVALAPGTAPARVWNLGRVAGAQPADDLLQFFRRDTARAFESVRVDRLVLHVGLLANRVVAVVN